MEGSLNEVKLDSPQTGGLSSIELSRNSKGYTWSIKMYEKPGQSIEEVFDNVHRMNALMNEKYGRDEK